MLCDFFFLFLRTATVTDLLGGAGVSPPYSEPESTRVKAPMGELRAFED